MKSNKIMAMVGAILCMASSALWGAQPGVEGEYDFIMQFRLFDGDQKELCKVKHWGFDEAKPCTWSGKPAEWLELFAGTDNRAYSFGRVCGKKPTGESLFCVMFDLTDGGYGDHGLLKLIQQDERSMAFYQYQPSPYSEVEFTYEHGAMFVDFYPFQNMQGDKLCTIEVGRGASVSACGESGERAHSAKIIGLPKNAKACFRAVKDEANRCYEGDRHNYGVYTLSIPDLNSKAVPRAKVTSKGDVLATKLYSVDLLQ
ncbi:hypothetical protein [Pseudomonas sp. RC3H12]|uniref:hypothetical protein n=1 Tax=Pseudomonas sp. RC3H12 TaxID=2834406 RepID=UPI001BDE34DF|nr:hypothetical protein [Pseudomonas sp. RC3H12]QWA28282.1 hypothetical protein KHO27_20630 [Pseudomonas sp. RC3H12]